MKFALRILIQANSTRAAHATSRINAKQVAVFGIDVSIETFGQQTKQLK